MSTLTPRSTTSRSSRSTVHSALLLLLVVTSVPHPRPLASALPISIGTDNVAGIWRLSSKVPFLSPPSPSRSKSNVDDEALLVLNADGSFAPCIRDDEGHERGGRDNDGGGGGENAPSFVFGGARRGGLWSFDLHRREVTLVPNRPDDADGRKVHDVVLCGAVGASKRSAADDDSTGREDAFLTIHDGSVAVGRCMYPRSHPNFFDEPGPIVRSTSVGTFRMVQVLGSLNTDLRSDDCEEEYDGGGSDDGVESGEASNPSYSDEDFLGRQFLLTVEPLRPRKKRYDYDDELTATMPLDVRVLPVEFHGNRTFTARGINKILRGRYSVKSYGGGAGDKAKLEMEVSLFGAGRSVSGSVYSEGRGLSHEDERSYSGQILETRDDRGVRTLFVRGSVVFGKDLGSDARPEPVGTFSMMETKR